MKITRLSVIPLRLPVKTPLVESGGVFSEFNHVLVELHSDAGVSGMAEVEAYPSFERDGVETQQGIVAVLDNPLREAIVGQSPFDLARIWRRMDQAVSGYLRVKAAIDIALYDLIGRHLGVPVHDLLGGVCRDDYIVEGVGYGISIDEPAVVAAIAEQAVRDGYRQLELKAGDHRPQNDVDRLAAVREAIGPDIPIKIDFNGYYDTKTAISVIQAMQTHGVQWIEQPARYWDFEALTMIRNAVNPIIVVDESVDTPQDMMRVARAGAADAVHIKPTIKGGLSTARAIASVAQAAGVVVVPGTSAPTGVGMAAARAFIATTPVLSGGAHGSPLDILVEDIVTDPIPAGSVTVPVSNRLPGLGIELNQAVVDRYRVG